MRIPQLYAVLCSALCLGCKDIITNPDIDLCNGPDYRTAKVEIFQKSATLKVGETLTLHSQVTNRKGSWDICLPPATWTSSDTTVVRVQHGFPLLEADRAIGVVRGSVYLKATSQKVSDSMLVQVRD